MPVGYISGGGLNCAGSWGEFIVKNRLISYVGITASIVGILSMLPISTATQSGQVSKPGFGESHEKPLPPGGPTPRTADGHPDLSGIWITGYTGSFDLTGEGNPLQIKFDPKTTPQEKVPFQRWVLEKRKRMGPLENAGPCLDCEPLGASGIFIKGGNYPVEIVQTAKQLVVLSELDTTYRIIWIDGRPHQKNPDPQFNGDAIGHWEGSTLVADVTGLDVHQWFMQGWFPSDVVHLTERLNRPDSNSFIYQFTVDDPKVLTHPWTSAPNHYSVAQDPLIEYYCTNNKDYDLQNAKGPKYIAAGGLDATNFHEQEYEQLRQQFPEIANK